MYKIFGNVDDLCSRNALTTTKTDNKKIDNKALWKQSKVNSFCAARRIFDQLL